MSEMHIAVSDWLTLVFSWSSNTLFWLRMQIASTLKSHTPNHLIIPTIILACIDIHVQCMYEQTILDREKFCKHIPLTCLCRRVGSGTALGPSPWAESSPKDAHSCTGLAPCRETTTPRVHGRQSRAVRSRHQLPSTRQTSLASLGNPAKHAAGCPSGSLGSQETELEREKEKEREIERERERSEKQPVQYYHHDTIVYNQVTFNVVIVSKELAKDGPIATTNCTNELVNPTKRAIVKQ